MTWHCEVCGEVLAAVRPHARYCSPRCRQTASRGGRRNVRLQTRRSEAMPSSTESANPQVSHVQSVTPSDPGTPGTPATVTVCRCPECLDWAADPGGWLDRVIFRAVAAAGPDDPRKDGP